MNKTSPSNVVMPPAPIAVKGFSPLDEQLALTASQYTPLMVEQMVRLGNSMPFRQAARVFAAFNQTELSYQTVRRQTEGAGASSVALESEQQANVELLVEPASNPPALGLISVDGAMVPLLKGEWAEVRTMVVGEVAQRLDVKGESSPHATRLSYYSRLCSAKEFEEQVWAELVRRGIPHAQAVVAVSDGAEWIQSLLDLNWQAAIRILDYTHAVQHLAQAGAAALGESSAAFKAWYAQQCDELKHGEAAQVVAAVRQLGSGAVVSQVVNYLDKRTEMMAYAGYQAKGYPIGSGCVESANKLVVEARLKGAGMHWARNNVNPMLSLRNAEANERWDENWAKLTPRRMAQRVRRKHGKAEHSGSVDVDTNQARSNEPAVQVSATSLPLLLPLAAASKAPHRPAADHPWRHDPIGKARFTRRSSSPNNL